MHWTRSPRGASTDILGNLRLHPAEAELRAREVFHPYHDEIHRALDRRAAAARPSILVSVHSFTPVFKDFARPWHAGVLYNRDSRLAEPLFQLLEAEGDLVIVATSPTPSTIFPTTPWSSTASRHPLGAIHKPHRRRKGLETWGGRLARLLLLASERLA